MFHSSNGTLSTSNYTKYAEVSINSQEASYMIEKGISYFWNPGDYWVAAHVVGEGNQCDIVTHSIMDAGGKTYTLGMWPKITFEYAIKELGTKEKTFGVE